MKKIFKDYLKKIIAAEDHADAVNNIFYGEAGIDMAYQQDKITYEEHEILSGLIDKLR